MFIILKKKQVIQNSYTFATSTKTGLLFCEENDHLLLFDATLNQKEDYDLSENIKITKRNQLWQITSNRDPDFANKKYRSILPYNPHSTLYVGYLSNSNSVDLINEGGELMNFTVLTLNGNLQIDNDAQVLIFIEDNKKMGVQNFSNKTVLPAKYESISIEYDIVKRRKYLKAVNNGSSQFFSLDGTSIKDNYLEYNHPRKEGNMIVIEKGGLSGAMDNNYQIVIPIKYKEISSLDNSNYLRVKSSNKYGVISENGETILSANYSNISIINREYFIVGSEYAPTDRLSSKYAEIINQLPSKYGIINANNRTILPTIYDAITPISESLFSLKISREYTALFDIKQNKELLRVTGDIDLNHIPGSKLLVVRENNKDLVGVIEIPN